MLGVTSQPDTETGDLIVVCADIVGAEHVLVSDEDLAAYQQDWSGEFRQKPLAVCRPRTAAEIAALVRICIAHNVALVPQGGRTGLCGGGVPIPNRRSIVLSTARMNAIRDIDQAARTITVESGVILETAQNAAADAGLVFPLTFGAQGSCSIGGVLATNAGGSNVVRYGMTRDLCVGIEAVLPDGSIINALTALRKDNTGYDIRNLLIGSEGTLGVITAAMFKLSPRPLVRATAFLALRSVDDAIQTLNRFQDESGGAVETFEYMPRPVVALICKQFPNMRAPLSEPAETGVFVELASSRRDDAEQDAAGVSRLQQRMLDLLEDLMAKDIVLDAMIAQSEQQRKELWSLREAVLESIVHSGPAYIMDLSLPLAKIGKFLDVMDKKAIDAGFQPITVGHLGDGNLHFALTAAKGAEWASLPLKSTKTSALDLLQEMGGSFSAEHGIGQSKLDLMLTRKEASQVEAMRKIKLALDPSNIMNPGKLVPLEALPH